MRKVIFIGIMLMTLLIGTVSASSLDLNTPTSTSTTLGVYVDSLYYAVTIEDGIISKVERNSVEKVDYIVKTDKKVITEFVIKYPFLSKLDRVKFITDKMDLPPSLIMDIAGAYVKNGN